MKQAELLRATVDSKNIVSLIDFHMFKDDLFPNAVAFYVLHLAFLTRF